MRTEDEVKEMLFEVEKGIEALEKSGSKLSFVNGNLEGKKTALHWVLKPKECIDCKEA